MGHEMKMSAPHIESSTVLDGLVFTRHNTGSRFFYTHTDQYFHSMAETVEHKNIRLKNGGIKYDEEPANNVEISVNVKFNQICCILFENMFSNTFEALHNMRTDF